jgi:hypothetical protein
MAHRRGWYGPPGEAQDTWFDDYDARKDRIVSGGLPTYIRGFRMLPDGFLAMWVDIDEDLLPRRHVDRRFDLHMTLGKKAWYNWNGISDESLQDLIQELNRRYAGTNRVFKIDRLGHGGAAMFHKDENFGDDPIIDFLYNHGGETKDHLHISL